MLQKQLSQVYFYDWNSGMCCLIGNGGKYGPVDTLSIIVPITVELC